MSRLGLSLPWSPGSVCSLPCSHREGSAKDRPRMEPETRGSSSSQSGSGPGLWLWVSSHLPDFAPVTLSWSPPWHLPLPAPCGQQESWVGRTGFLALWHQSGPRWRACGLSWLVSVTLTVETRPRRCLTRVSQVESTGSLGGPVPVSREGQPRPLSMRSPPGSQW